VDLVEQPPAHMSLGSLETRLCDLSSSLPCGPPSAQAERLALEDELANLPTVASSEGADVPPVDGPEGFMDSLASDAPYDIDLVSNFASDVAVDPLSLDEFIEL